MIDAISLLQKLVAVDSTSAKSNLPLLKVLHDAAAPLGFAARWQTWRDAAGVEKANLILRRGPDAPGGLALVGHADCVPFDPGWEGALAGEVQGGKLYGRGAADTKAFHAAAIAAAARAADRPVCLVFTADEEVGCLGAKKLLEEKVIQPARAIIGEPTRLIPVRGHKGYCLAEVEVRGQEAHSAYPSLGASAILGAGRLLQAIEEAQEELARQRNADFDPPWTTFNVGLIEGGKAKNVIPGECRFTLEWRPIPGQPVEHALRLIEAACARIGGKLSATARALRMDAGVSVPGDAPLIRFLEEASGNRAETIPFGTELPQLTALGAEACVFGPGDIRVAHKTGEFVPLDDLAKAERILAAAIDRFA